MRIEINVDVWQNCVGASASIKSVDGTDQVRSVPMKEAKRYYVTIEVPHPTDGETVEPLSAEEVTP